MQKLAIATVLSLLAISMASVAAPRECGAEVTQIDAGTESLYLVDTGEGWANGWVYLEQNGEEGLQRGGAGALNDTPVFIHYDGDCDGANPDQVLY